MVDVQAISKAQLEDVDLVLWNDTLPPVRSRVLAQVGDTLKTWLSEQVESEEAFNPIVVGTGLDFQAVVVPVVETLAVSVGCFWPFASRDGSDADPLVYLQQEYWEPPQYEAYTHVIIIQAVVDQADPLETLRRRALELAPQADTIVLAAAIEENLLADLVAELGERNVWAAQAFELTDGVATYWEIADDFNPYPRKIVPRIAPWLVDRIKYGPSNAPRLGLEP